MKIARTAPAASSVVIHIVVAAAALRWYTLGYPIPDFLKRTEPAPKVESVRFMRTGGGSANGVTRLAQGGARKAGKPAAEKQLVILDLGIHLLYIARVFMGEVERIACETQRINPAIAAEDMATMLLRHASGAVSVVDCSYASRQIPDPFPQTLIHIDGRKGSLKVDRDFEMEVSSEGALRQEYIGSPLLSWTSQPWHAAQESVLNTQAHFIDCLVRGGEPATSGADNLKTYALVMAAYAAAQSHRSETPRARGAMSGLTRFAAS